MRVLFVCLGNICRSPTAEAVMKKYKGDWDIDSAATGIWHVGKPPDMRAQAEARKRGYDLSKKRARLFGAADFYQFDKIYVMDRNNLAAVEAQRPAGNDTPVELFLGNVELADPYYDGSFSEMFDQVEKRAKKLAQM